MFSSLRGKKSGDIACIFVHAGAGYHSVQNETVHLTACNDAAKAAMAVLRAGGSATDAVEIAIKVLEDREITNAGYGSNLAIDGVVECDAVIVNHSGQSGGVGAVAQIKNPISLARVLLDHTEKPMTLRRVPPNFLVGQGATDFAYEHGMSVLAIDNLISPGARERWKRWRNDLAKVENNKRREENGKYGLPSRPSETDMVEYLHLNYDFELDRKSHTQAMKAGLYNEGQPISPPPTSDIRADFDNLSPSRATRSTSSTPGHESSKSSSGCSEEYVYFDPNGPPEMEDFVAGSSQKMPWRRDPVSPGAVGSQSGGDSDQFLHRTCGSEMQQNDIECTGRNSLSARSGWQDGSSGSDSNHTAVMKTGRSPSQSFLQQDSHDGYGSSPSLRARTEHGCSSAVQPGISQSSPSPEHEDLITDTVGAVAVDVYGQIACGASSGGIGMKHRGRIGPAAIVGTGAHVIPVAEGDRDGVSVATVTSGTGEHMATTMAAKTCSDRVYSNQRTAYGGKLEECGDDEAIYGFIEKDFMGHPSVKQSHSTGAIGMLTLKKSNQGIYLYYGHNTDSFALASMHSDEVKPVCTMSRNKGNSVIAQGGRAIRYRKKR